MNTIPFHEITDEAFDKLVDEVSTWEGVMERYHQPKWCTYPEALGGEMGCWSLTGRRITCKKDCGSCDRVKRY